MYRLAILLAVLSLAACQTESTDASDAPGATASESREATARSTLLLDYEARLEDGTVADAGQNVTFRLLELVPGFREGVIGMRAGETRTFDVPPEKAYGATGGGPIPPNATLTFEVTVHEVLN